MMRTRSMLLPSLLLVVTLLPMTTASAQMSQVTVDPGVMCTQIVEREPAGVDTTFAADVGLLYSFTRILGVQGESSVTHVWYHGDEERARVNLPVRSPSWRTFSSKQIMPHETGSWRVEVLDAGGSVVSTIRFTIGG